MNVHNIIIIPCQGRCTGPVNSDYWPEDWCACRIQTAKRMEGVRFKVLVTLAAVVLSIVCLRLFWG
jgi:hypothetical protein